MITIKQHYHLLQEDDNAVLERLSTGPYKCIIKAIRAVRNLPCYWVQIHVKDKVVTVALQSVGSGAYVSDDG